MKFIRSQKSDDGARIFIFMISQRDKALLLSVLKMFPLVDARSHRLSRHPSPETRASQPLLLEAMEQQRLDHSKKIGRLLKNEGRFFRELEDSYQFAVNGEQLEWLLQALNDVRVGSWTKLGCPEMQAVRKLVLNEKTAVHVTAMELSGYFQNAFLAAFQED